MKRLLVACSLVLALPLFADDLPHRVRFGAQVMPGEGGVAVGQVFPDTPAAAADVRSGDVITSIGGTKVSRPDEFIGALKGRRPGAAKLVVMREGKPVTLSVELTEAPRETSAEYDVIYDSAPANGALRRLIVTRPHGAGRRPAVLFAGGIGCYSLENTSPGTSGYIALIQELTRQGFVVMRVEKSGMGDSLGVPCALQDFDNELAGYRAGLAALRRYDYVDPSRVFLVGHSIGGIVAPVIATETALRGVVAISTAGHKWLDYEAVNARRQMSMEGTSGKELETRLALRRGCAKALLADRLTPEAILAKQPGCAEFLEYPAHYSYVQQVAALDLPKLWRKVSAPVLLVYGASDFVTDLEEHKVIERASNAAHKGHAKVIVEPRMDHFMRDVASQQESMRLAKANQTDDQPLQEQVRADVVAWLKKQL